MRRDHPALGRGTLRWLDAEGLLCFAREPGFILAANLGAAPVPLPVHREILLASGPVTDGSLPPDTAAWLSSHSTLEAMPKVRVPRKNVTPGEVVAVLSRRLGPGYQVESNGDHRVTVRKSQLMYANISIADQPGASVFRVHGGGLVFLRIVNTFGTARRTADALRRSPEFRSL